MTAEIQLNPCFLIDGLVMNLLFHHFIFNWIGAPKENSSLLCLVTAKWHWWPTFNQQHQPPIELSLSVLTKLICASFSTSQVKFVNLLTNFERVITWLLTNCFQWSSKDSPFEITKRKIVCFSACWLVTKHTKHTEKAARKCCLSLSFSLFWYHNHLFGSC